MLSARGLHNKIPLTKMRYVNGWVVRLVLRQEAEDFFLICKEWMERLKISKRENRYGIK